MPDLFWGLKVETREEGESEVTKIKKSFSPLCKSFLVPIFRAKTDSPKFKHCSIAFLLKFIAAKIDPSYKIALHAQSVGVRQFKIEW